MNKKILISLSVIAAVAAIVIGGTVAYFSDVETSTGNTFTAGSIDLKIDNTSYLNGVLSPSTSWTLNDLTDQLFFNFSDLKPGDWGEDTVSMYVDNNDAWACMTFKDLTNTDESCTEPELKDDAGCPGNGGDLAQQLYFTFWKDDGDNVFGGSQGGEYLLLTNKKGPASDVLDGKTYPIADKNFSIAGSDASGNGLPLTGSNDYYIGKAWCFGTMIIDETTGAITCNGAAVDNASQSDKVTGTIEFYAVQARNNPDFVCRR